MNEVRKRVAIITGAARGIGKAAFSRLRTEGVTVVGTDILLDPEDQETQEESASKNLDISLIHDVADESSWVKVVDVTLEKYGQIDILVNNAGIGTLPDIEEEDESAWGKMQSVNARSIWLGMKTVVPSMRSRQSGAIVNVSSIFGASGGFGKSASYHASKGAVSAITRNAAVRYAADNIRINAVSPGFINVSREEKAIREAGDKMS